MLLVYTFLQLSNFLVLLTYYKVFMYYFFFIHVFRECYFYLRFPLPQKSKRADDNSVSNRLLSLRDLKVLKRIQFFMLLSPDHNAGDLNINRILLEKNCMGFLQWWAIVRFFVLMDLVTDWVLFVLHSLQYFAQIHNCTCTQYNAFYNA